MYEPEPPPSDTPVSLPSGADRPLGPGWWQASDLRFYPPHLAPGQPAVPPSSQGASTPPTAFAPIESVASSTGIGPGVAPATPIWPTEPVPVPTWPSAPSPAGPDASRTRSRQPRPWWVAAVGGIAALSVLVPVTWMVASPGADDQQVADDPGSATFEPVAPADDPTPEPPDHDARQLGPASPGGLSVLADDFDDAASGWGTGATWTYDAGAFVISAETLSAHWPIFRRVPDAVEMNASVELPGDGGLVGPGCEYSPSGANSSQFALVVDGAGSVVLGVFDGTALRELSRVTTVRAAPALGLLCEDVSSRTELGVKLTPIVDGEQFDPVIRWRPAAVPPTRSWWTASVVGRRSRTGAVRVNEVSVLDPKRRPMRDGGPIGRDGDVLASGPLSGTPAGWDIDRVEGDGLAEHTSDGIGLLSRDGLAYLMGPVLAEDGPIDVAATTLSIMPADADEGASASGVGVGCSGLADGGFWTYTMVVASDGTWNLIRTAAVTRDHLAHLGRGGSAPARVAPLTVRLTCVPDTDPDRLPVVRVVGSVGEHVLVDIVDPTPAAVVDWRPVLAVQSQYGATVNGRFIDHVISAPRG